MIERKFLPLVVAVFVLTAGLSGGATVAVLSDSATVNVQVSPGNVTATVVDSPTAPAADNVTASEAENGTEELDADEVDGIVVALDPADGSVDAGETTEYDVVVRGATEGIVGYDLTAELSDSSVASFEGFEHHYSDTPNATDTTISGDRIDVSAGLSRSIPNMSEDDTVVLGTLTVRGDSGGTTSLELVNETADRLTVSKNTDDTEDLYYKLGAMKGSELTVNAAPSAEDAAYTVSKTDTLSIPVLENDSNSDGDEVTVSIVSDPSEGELSRNMDGSLTYDPHSSFTGQDTFTYKVDDGDSGTATTTVTITVEKPGSGD